MQQKITYGTRELNKLLDQTLMQKYKFPSETLMEIAGISIAKLSNYILKSNSFQQPSICILVGPGNNGGDGLVAARHLKMQAYNVTVLVFKQLLGKNGIYQNLCQLNGIKCLNAVDQQFHVSGKFQQYLSKFDFIIDAIFGFPFVGQIREPYTKFLPNLHKLQDRILSVDIPSGWDANQGNIKGLFHPKWVIALGIPKMCHENFKGQVYLGGRFIPNKVCEELSIVLPKYNDEQFYVKL